MTTLRLGALVALIGGIGSLAWMLAHKEDTTVLFSTSQMLGILWHNYKADFLEASSFRPIDFDRGITTSEGVSYSMLRAVWLADRENFDGSWEFAKNNLRRDDHLFAWLFGERPDGTYGVLTEQGGDTSATDADSDIALALIFAYARWRDPQYLAAAQVILANLWEKSVIEVNGSYVLLANDREKFIRKDYVLVNPSYLSPYAYRIFAQADPAHPWLDLVDASYDLIERSARESLDAPSSGGLPPDWIEMHRTTGALRAASSTDLTTRYGYDALRIPWRLTLDYLWFNEPRARSALEAFTALESSFDAGGIPAVFNHDGTAAESRESIAMYGGALGYFMIHHPHKAERVYRETLLSQYNRDTYAWKEPLSYYDDNWAWFGMALYTGALQNLSLAWCPELSVPGSCLQSSSTQPLSL